VAYIVSQRHAGWVALADMYDDGGLSGGTMERPALKRLLEDVQASKVQTVVVYKVDRLTRSLADFAKIVDVLDAYNASFVSVTQQFNTTTSMGRLTLNMLLSFAQFEREIAGERFRDKIAASKKKGMWMGGNVPLGYDVKDRKLIINEPVLEPVALAVQLQNMDMLRQRSRSAQVRRWHWKTLVHLLERQIRRDDGRAAFMTLAEDLESSSAPVGRAAKAEFLELTQDMLQRKGTNLRCQPQLFALPRPTWYFGLRA
jgi:DNA invertase Pin-like site-specific DNA recombinase